MSLQIKQHKVALEHFQKRLKHPGKRLNELAQHLDNLESRLSLAVKQNLLGHNNRLALSKASLFRQDPRHQISQQLDFTESLSKRLTLAFKNRTQSEQMRFNSLTQRLHNVSPLATLQRGYSITETEKGELLKSTNQIKAGDKIKTRLGSGSVSSNVIDIH